MNDNELTYKRLMFYCSEQDETWFEDWFMLPRIGDFIYYNVRWWKVTQVYLLNNKPYRIYVNFAGYD